MSMVTEKGHKKRKKKVGVHERGHSCTREAIVVRERPLMNKRGHSVYERGHSHKYTCVCVCVCVCVMCGVLGHHR